MPFTDCRGEKMPLMTAKGKICPLLTARGKSSIAFLPACLFAVAVL